jgi:hypothetical protein
MNNLFKVTKKIVGNNTAVRHIFNGSRKLQQTQTNVEAATGLHLPLTTLSDDELAMKETVARLAQEQIAPHVRAMEDEGRFKDSVIDMLFNNGVSTVCVKSSAC